MASLQAKIQDLELKLANQGEENQLRLNAKNRIDERLDLRDSQGLR